MRISTRQSGLSIIEMMVGLVIGMITVLVVVNSMSFVEGQRRGTNSGLDAVNNATLAAYLIERDVRMAGYGLTSAENNGLTNVCAGRKVLMYNQTRSPAEFEFDVGHFVPIVINPTGYPAGDANTDVLMINYTGSDLGVASIGIDFEQQSGASANYKVGNRNAFRTGDLVIAVEAGEDCVVSEITGLPGDPKCNEPGSNTDVVIHNNGQYNNSYKGCSKVDSTWNKPGGLGVTFSSGKLYTLGQPDEIHSTLFAVRNGQLTICDVFARDCTKTSEWQSVASDIVGLRAELALDTNEDGTVETWRAGLCSGVGCVPTADQVTQLRLARIAVVARSQKYERTAITQTAPAWQGQTTLGVSALTDWDHYRYHVSEALIPIRNTTWAKR
ncbi:MAG: PilW family protein [Azonexus sp.]|nr:PilW family protein [Azonexus sp.]MDZ4315471.1 PilW family protein [Azonexus sp.]